MMSRPLWLSSLPDNFIPSVEAWLDIGDSLPFRISKLLGILHEKRAPFLLPFVVYLIQASPDKLNKYTSKVVRTCEEWIKVWEKQGSPESLDEFLLIGSWGTQSARSFSLTIGYVLDKALETNEAPVIISGFACMLLGSRYKIHLGWYNLRGFPEPLVRILMGRAGASDPMIVSEDRAPIVKHLSKNMHQPWGKYLLCVAIALVGETRRDGNLRRGPISDRDYLDRATIILKIIHDNKGLDIQARYVASLLESYIERKLNVPENSKRSTRASMVQTYLNCIASQWRYLQEFPEHEHHLAPYRLPRPNRPVMGLSLADICAETKQRRQVDVNAAHPELFRWLSLAEARRDVARMICAKASTVSGDCAEFNVILPDNSAMLKFRLVPNSDIQEHSKKDVNSQANLIEYLGHEGPGDIYGKRPFFVYLHRAYLDNSFLDSLTKIGYRRSDFRGYDSGILGTRGAYRCFCKKMMDYDIDAGVEPRTYMDPDAFAFAMSAAYLEIELMLSAGMRVHELQQIRVDIDFKYPGSDIPVLYMDEKYIYVLIYPKGHKPAQNKPPVQYRFPNQIKDSWVIMREHHRLLWGVEQCVDFENGAGFGIKPAPFLFQAHGKIIGTIALRMLLPNILLGHKAIREDSLVASAKPHILRALNMNEAVASGVNLDDISRNMHGGDKNMTQHYLSELLPFKYNLEKISYWDALCVDFQG